MTRIIRQHRGRRFFVLDAALACGAAVAAILILAPMAETPAVAASPAAADPIVGAAGVVDGDGLRIDGIRIRLHGVDAFERAQTCGGHACGRASAEHLDRLTRGARVRCTPLDVDRYGRTVARCEARGIDVGAAQVEAGHALAHRRYSLDYVPQEDAARRARRGAWATGFTRPEDWRRAN